MRASFAEEKSANVYSPSTTQTPLSLLIKFAKWKALRLDLLLHQEWRPLFYVCSFTASRATICFVSSVLVLHSLFMNYFPKWNIQTTYFDINQPETIESLLT